MIYDIIIVGAGVIGGMVARELSKYHLSVCLLEKGNDVAVGASKANSGIVHGGYDPEPGTLKAKLNVQGVELLYQAAEELQVPCKRNGSLICAFGPEEEAGVKALYQRGLENGVPELALLTGEEVRALEPALSPAVTLAMRVPTAGIVCPYELTIAAVGNAMDNGVELKRNFAVTGIEHAGEGFTVTSQTGEQVAGKTLINCAGCYSDGVAALAGDCDFAILPRAGEYLLLDKSRGNTVSHTIFQVPTKEGKGILVTPTVDGNLLTGPTAGVVDGPEHTETTPMGLQTVQALAKKSVPDVDFSQVITSFTGVRSSVESGDFIIRPSRKVPGLVHVAAIDSPGLTCCVAIARYVTGILQQMGVDLREKEHWNGRREDPHFFRHMSDQEKNQIIQKDPAYGKIVCRCETVTEGEIRDALRRNPVPLDVDGVKRRTRSGMGRCQGGFCAPYVMELIAKEREIPMETVTKKGDGSQMLAGRL